MDFPSRTLLALPQLPSHTVAFIVDALRELGGFSATPVRPEVIVRRAGEPTIASLLPCDRNSSEERAAELAREPSVVQVWFLDPAQRLVILGGSPVKGFLAP